ncbi:MAG: hypothetical protein K0Q59_3653 [Paenibacillus sp.]|nr:hypothetical protein [Paenibacillus sp.]
MGTAIQLLVQTKRQLGGWSWFKKTLLIFALLIFGTSSFLYLTPPGSIIREFLAQTVISTQHRSWAWIVVGAEKRDDMVKLSHQFTETSALEKQDLDLIKFDPVEFRKSRTIDELVSEPKEISGQFWKGKMIYVYDPTTVRVVVPNKAGEGERISSMVTRTGAVAGINGGGFVDPDGLGNGFAPIGLIMSGFQPVYVDVGPTEQQHIVGFTKEGTLVIGKYSLQELQQMGVKDAVSFLAPRLIANGNPQITSGDGGWGRAPRTAIGQKEDGTLIFVIIDGRQTSSVGATLKEVQDLLLKEGAVNAGMMDGGASSELVYNGQLVTKPSSKYGERRLPSGVVVLDNPDSYTVDHIWDGITKIDPGGAYDHPDFLKDLAEQRARAAQQPKVDPPKTEPAKTEPAKTDTSKTEPAKTDDKTKETANNTTTKPNTGSSGTPAAGSGSTGSSGTPAAGTGTTGNGGTPAAGTGTTGNGGTPAAGTGTTGSSGTSAGTGNTGNGGTPAASGTTGGASGSATTPAAGTGSSGTTGTPATGTSTSGNTGSPAAAGSGSVSGTTSTPPATSNTPVSPATQPTTTPTSATTTPAASTAPSAPVSTASPTVPAGSSTPNNATPANTAPAAANAN